MHLKTNTEATAAGTDPITPAVTVLTAAARKTRVRGAGTATNTWGRSTSERSRATC